MSIRGADISQLIVEALFDVVGCCHLGLAFNNEAIVELANGGIVRRSLLLAENDLVGILVACGLWIVQVAAHDLVASHHDVGASIITDSISTVALVVRKLIVWCKNGLELLTFEADRLDQAVTIATLGDMRCCCLLSGPVSVT